MWQGCGAVPSDGQSRVPRSPFLRNARRCGDGVRESSSGLWHEFCLERRLSPLPRCQFMIAGFRKQEGPFDVPLKRKVFGCGCGRAVGSGCEGRDGKRAVRSERERNGCQHQGAERIVRGRSESSSEAASCIQAPGLVEVVRSPPPPPLTPIAPRVHPKGPVGPWSGRLCRSQTF
jgi:hypothetical protein